MIDARALAQTTLDTALYPDVRVFWLRKSDGEDPDEYVVYTLSGDPAVYADDEPLTRNANITVKYYYRDSMLDSSAGRAAIKAREAQIAEALQGAGFLLPGGWFDSGDIDDIGFGTTIFEAYYSRVT
jgi:hypothetical protein